MSVLLAVVAILVPHGHSHKTLTERIPCDQGHPRNCVTRAVRHYGFTGWRRAWMYRIPGCESTWRWNAYNGILGASGLYQFVPSTWRSTPYGARSIWSVKWQAMAAGWMLRVGRSNEWECR